MLLMFTTIAGRLLFVLIDILAFLAYGVLLAYAKMRGGHSHNR
jgi:hypothetical protein